MADTHLTTLLEASPESIVELFEGPANLLQELLTGLKKRRFGGAAFLVVDDGSRLHLGAFCGAETGHKAGDLIKELAPVAGGKGGGKADLARGAAPEREKKGDLLEAVRSRI